VTDTAAITNEMDHLDQLGASAFNGFLVRKYSRQYLVPTYVVEFLLGRYCASTDPSEIEEGLQIVEKQAKVLLMPVSARRGLNDLPDDLWTKISIECYKDPEDAVFKGLEE
jgi:predicted ATP-dependent Lon-type protease